MKWILLLGLAACAAAGGDAPLVSGVLQSKKTVEIAVAHAGGWRVTYTFSTPTLAIGFKRPHFAPRNQWKIVSPEDARLVRDERGDRIVATQPFSEIVLAIETDAQSVEKDYQLFFPFTSGATLLYSGHFDALPLTCKSASCADFWTPREEDVATTFLFIPREGEWLVLPDGAHDRTTQWVSPEEGTYVYFGNDKPATYATFTSVIDPGFPKWLREPIVALLPKLLDEYARRTEHALPWKPRIFMSFVEVKGDRSISITGNTQNALVQLEVRLGLGRKQNGDREVVARALHLVAHEVAHLWNAAVFPNHGGDWLSEGGAEAFADRALRDLDFLTPSKFDDAQSSALSLCLFGLADTALDQSSLSGKFKNYYWCGDVLQFWLEAALKQKYPANDLFTFWTGIFTGDEGYDDTTIAKRLSALGLDSLAADFERVEHGQVTADWLIPRLRKAGLVIAEVTDTKKIAFDYAYAVSNRALAAVAESACGADAVVHRRAEDMVIDAPAPCSLSAFAFKTVEGQGPQGLKLYDAMAAACAAHKPLHLAGTAAQEVPCRVVVPPRPPFFHVGTATAETAEKNEFEQSKNVKSLPASEEAE